MDTNSISSKRASHNLHKEGDRKREMKEEELSEEEKKAWRGSKFAPLPSLSSSSHSQPREETNWVGSPRSTFDD